MQIAYKEFSSTRKFGVELEVDPIVLSGGEPFGDAKSGKAVIANTLRCFESLPGNRRVDVLVEGGDQGWAESIDNDYWHVKYDSSCGPTGKKKKDGGGWEVASYVGSGINDIIHIAKAAHYLGSQGVQVNPFCGLHIHANVEDCDKTHMSNLMGHWLKIEPIISHALPERRKKNKYCKPLRSRLKKHYCEGMLLSDSIGPKNLSCHENPEKKYSINSVGWVVGERPTLEIRWPECVLDRMHIYNWTLFFINFIDACFMKPFDSISPVTSVEDLLEIVGLQNPEDEPFLILDEHLHLLKLWLLRRITECGSNQIIISEAKDKLDFLANI